MSFGLRDLCVESASEKRAPILFWSTHDDDDPGRDKPFSSRIILAVWFLSEKKVLPVDHRAPLRSEKNEQIPLVENRIFAIRFDCFCVTLSIRSAAINSNARVFPLCPFCWISNKRCLPLCIFTSIVFSLLLITARMGERSSRQIYYCHSNARRLPVPRGPRRKFLSQTSKFLVLNARAYSPPPPPEAENMKMQFDWMSRWTGVVSALFFQSGGNECHGVPHFIKSSECCKCCNSRARR